eukprot:366379-Chlamydomonas_euryale.AAC.3
MLNCAGPPAPPPLPAAAASHTVRLPPDALSWKPTAEGLRRRKVASSLSPACIVADKSAVQRCCEAAGADAAVAAPSPSSCAAAPPLLPPLPLASASVAPPMAPAACTGRLLRRLSVAMISCSLACGHANGKEEAKHIGAEKAAGDEKGCMKSEKASPRKPANRVNKAL